MCVFIICVKVTEWPPIGKIAAHSAYEMFWFKQYLFHQIFQHLYNFHRRNTGSDGKQCLYLSHLLIHSGKKNRL